MNSTQPEYGDGIFGLKTNYENAQLVYVPVSWDVTTSYGKGTSSGPQAILAASEQVDLYDHELGSVYQHGIHLYSEDTEIQELNHDVGKLYSEATSLFTGETPPADHKEALELIQKINQASNSVNERVYQTCKKILEDNKTVAIIGGDHSVPYGAIQAASEKHSSLGILHIDAHMDFRNAYQGFQHSHASIMRNVMTQFDSVEKIVQVGIRDFCEDELQFSKDLGTRCQTYFDADFKRQIFEGKSQKEIFTKIIDSLPKKVWISFDIDGLDPRFCPNTGTPVPGGLSFEEANYLGSLVVQSGRQIIGFDLCEVSPGKDDEWDANVGARLLYKLTGWTLKSLR